MHRWMHSAAGGTSQRLKPAGYVAPVQTKKLITRNDVFVYDALKTPQFWLIWWVLCLNVTAGIGIIGMASPMLQEVFAGKLIGVAKCRIRRSASGEPIIAPPPKPMIAMPVAMPRRSGNHLMSVETGEM